MEDKKLPSGKIVSCQTVSMIVIKVISENEAGFNQYFREYWTEAGDFIAVIEDN